MFCLSDLLSQIYLEQSNDPQSRDLMLSIHTHRLVPELIYAEPDPYFNLLTGIIPSLAPLCIPGSTLRLSVESPKTSADLCAMEFKFFLKTEFSETEVSQRLGSAYNACNELGAWLELDGHSDSTMEVSIEINLRAKVPNSAMSSPSWLYSKPTTLVGGMTSRSYNTKEMLRNSGALVTEMPWQGIETINELVSRIGSADNRNLHVIDLDNLDLPADELLDILESLTKSGLLAGQLEFLVLVHPKFIPLIPEHISHHIGYKLIKAPLTNHRLINPKSTLMVAHNLATQNLTQPPTPLKVMLVEDCELSRRLMRCYLEEKGLKVFEAADGETALELAGDKQFDAILMDLALPGMNGFETTQLLRQWPTHARTPIIGITASRDLNDFSNCYTHGMNDCISKPLYLNEVVKRIVSWAQMSHTAVPAKTLVQA
ncbi:MAG: response regulator [Limnobacter sp.]|nr:response regulator [Limnobacter sp.]